MNTTKKLKREARRLSTKFIRQAEDHVRDQENIYIQVTRMYAPAEQQLLIALQDWQHAKKILKEYKERYNDVRDMIVLRRMTPEERFFAKCLGGCFPFTQLS